MSCPPGMCGFDRNCSDKHCPGRFGTHSEPTIEQARKAATIFWLVVVGLSACFAIAWVFGDRAVIPY